MIVPIVILGFLLRIVSLDQSLWLDEATSLLTVRNFSFWEIITKFSPGDFHPPLYYLLLKIWILIFGSGEVPARLFSVILGVLTIVVVYLIGKEFGNKFIALAGALLLATSPLHIYYSQEARMYSLATLFVALAIFSFMKTLKAGGVGYWVLFSLAISGAVATDYLPIFVLPIFWLYGLVVKKNFPWWKKFIVSHIILGVLGLVWLPIFGRQILGGLNVSSTSPLWWNVLGPASVKNLLLIPVKFMIGRISFDNRAIYGFIIMIVSLLFVFLLIKSLQIAKKITLARLIWFWLIVPPVLITIVSLKIPMLSYFRLLFVLPALYLLVAIGLNRLTPFFQKIMVSLLVIINIFASGYYLANTKFQREDWRGLVSYIASQKSDNSITLFPADSQMEAYKYYSPLAKIAGPEGFNKKYQEIWLMRYVQLVFDPADNLRTKIESAGYKKTGEYDFNSVGVWRYQK